MKEKDSPIRLGIILLIISGIMGLILGGANYVTRDLIAEKKDAANKAAYAKVLPEGVDTGSLTPLDVPEEYASTILEAYSADDSGYAMRVSGKGYGGNVIIAVGMTPEGILTGVCVVEHSETPGLGANASNASFTDQFIGKSGVLTVVKGDASEGQISAISGATITSRCVTGSVNAALSYYESVLKGGK